MKIRAVILLALATLLMIATPTYSLYTKVVELESADIIFPENGTGDAAYLHNKTTVISGSGSFDTVKTVKFAAINLHRESQIILNQDYSASFTLQVAANVPNYSLRLNLKIKVNDDYVLVETKTLSTNNTAVFYLPEEYDFPAKIATRRDFMLEFVQIGTANNGKTYNYTLSIDGIKR